MDDEKIVLNPFPIALSFLETFDCDELIEIVHSSGINIDLNLSKQESYSHKTRKRAFIPRIKQLIEGMREDESLHAIFLLYRNIIRIHPEIETEVNSRLTLIGWKLIDGSLTVVDAKITELFFEKGLVHDAYVKT